MNRLRFLERTGGKPLAGVRDPLLPSGLLPCELVEERPADDYQQNEQDENRSRVRPEAAVTDSATACSDSTYTANAV